METNGHSTTVSPSHQLLRRLDDPRTAGALNRLLDRLDLLSFAVEATGDFLHRGEELADNLGGALAEARAAVPAVNGAALAGRLPHLASAGAKLVDAAASPAFARLLDSGLLDRLAAPETITSLQILLDKLPLLTFVATAADQFLHRGEELADNLGGALAEAKAAAPAVNGAALASAGAKLVDAAASPAFARLLDSGLLDRLAAPDTIASLQVLLDNLPAVTGNELTDNVRDVLHEAVQGSTVPVDQKNLRQSVVGLPKVVRAMARLIDSGLFDAQVVDVLVEVGKQAAEGYRNAKHSPDNPVGRWGLFRALGDPDVQRAVGVALFIVKRFGQTFNRSDISPTSTPAM